MKKVMIIAACALLSLAHQTTRGFDTGGNGQGIDIGKEVDYCTGGSGGVRLPGDGKKYDFDYSSKPGWSLPSGETGGTLPFGGGKKQDLTSVVKIPARGKTFMSNTSFS